MNGKKGVIGVNGLERTIGLKLKVRTYVADRVEEREKVIFSIRQLYRLLSMIRNNKIIYGISVGNDSIILHLFVDRGILYNPYDVNNKDNGG